MPRFQAKLNFSHPVFGTTRAEREEALSSIAHACLEAADGADAEGPIFADDGEQLGTFRVTGDRKRRKNSGSKALANLVTLREVQTGRLATMYLKTPDEAWQAVLAERKAAQDAPALEQARHARASEAARRGHANRRARLDALVAAKAGK